MKWDAKVWKSISLRAEKPCDRTRHGNGVDDLELV